MRKPVLILGGCLVVLLLVCCVGAAAFFMFGNPGQMVAGFLGESDLGSVSATLQAVAPTTAAGTTRVPTKASSSATQPATSKTTASSGDPFANAMANAKTATKFRVEFSWIFGGMQQGKYQETALIDSNGEVDGQNSHFTAKGLIVAGPSMNPNTVIEVIEVNGITYMKGSALSSKAEPDLWYVTDQSTTASFSDFAKVDEYKDRFGTQSEDIKKARNEKLDNQNCDVYAYSMKSLQDAAIWAMLGPGWDKNAFSVTDKGEVDFWICGDGFVHKFALDYEGHDSGNATQKAALKMTWHAWDFNNAAIAVTAPKDAKTMPK